MKEKKRKFLLTVEIIAVIAAIASIGILIGKNLRPKTEVIDQQYVDSLQQTIKSLEAENKFLAKELEKLYKKLEALLYHLGKKTALEEVAEMRK